jgi:peptidoglycan/LPS O-acetylase OafA/YrhL
VRSYALRRALRLVPAYYVALAISFLAHPKNLPTLTDTLTHLTFLHSFVPLPNTVYSPVFWSLTPEVVFYALLPLLILKIRGPYQRLALFGALVAVALALQVYMYAIVNPEKHLIDYLMGFPLTHLWLFIAGMLLRMLVERLDERSPGDYWPTVASLLFLGSSAMFALFPYTSFLKDLPASYMIGDCIVIVFFASALFGSPIFSRILAWRPLGFVGKISYSLFLLHYTVLMLIRRHVFPLVDEQLAQLDGAAAFIAYAGYVGGTLIVAGTLSYLSYRYIESPFLRIKPK